MIRPTHETIQADLSQIAGTLEGSWHFNRVVATRDRQGFHCRRGWNWQQLLPAIFSCFLSDAYRQENSDTVDYFWTIFGRKRIQEISRRHNLHLDFKFNHGIALTRYDVEVIFGSMGDVRVGDLETIFREVKANPDTYLHLAPLKTNQLKTIFADRAFQDLTKADIDELYNVAVPFQSLETMFMNEVSNDYAHWADRDYSWRGTKTRIYLMEEMRRSGNASQFECNIRKIKRILDYHTPTGERDGLLLWDTDGYRFVFKRIDGGGAYKFLLKALTKTETYRSQIAYLGTQFMSYVPDSWQSGLEDFRENIGAGGPVATYYETEYYLHNPSAGFVDTTGEKIDFTGMSLGGAQALRDSCLFIDQVRKITAVCNPGIDKNTYRWFAAKTWELTERISLEYIWEKDDLIPLIGDGHLGLGCDPNHVEISVRMLAPITNDQEVSPLFPERPHRPEGTWDAINRIWASLFGAHVRETTLGTFRRTNENRHLDQTYRSNFLRNNTQINVERLDRDVLSNTQYGWEQIRRDWFGWLSTDDRFSSLLERVQPLTTAVAAV